MSKQIWVLPEIYPAGAAGKVSAGLLTAARNSAAQVNGAVTALVFAPHPTDFSKILGEQGVPRACVFQDPVFAKFSPEAYAAALLPHLREEKPWLLLLGATALGRELAPHLAARLDTALVTDCVKMDLSNPEQPVFSRPAYGGQLYREMVWKTDKTLLVTLDAKAFPPAPPASAVKTDIVVIASNLPAGLDKAEHLEYLPADFKTVDVTEANTIVTAGLGAATERLYPLVAELAALVAGSIGATRPVVDSGTIPRERMIGQTGKTVSPDFYLALGVSGATHHTGGIQASGKIVAVNKDQQAPIFQSADAGAAADLEAVLPLLIARIKKAKADGEIL